MKNCSYYETQWLCFWFQTSTEPWHRLQICTRKCISFPRKRCHLYSTWVSAPDRHLEPPWHDFCWANRIFFLCRLEGMSNRLWISFFGGLTVTLWGRTEVWRSAGRLPRFRRSRRWPGGFCSLRCWRTCSPPWCRSSRFLSARRQTL